MSKHPRKSRPPIKLAPIAMVDAPMVELPPPKPKQSKIMYWLDRIFSGKL
jgi:hypothetical protein